VSTTEQSESESTQFCVQFSLVYVSLGPPCAVHRYWLVIALTGAPRCKLQLRRFRCVKSFFFLNENHSGLNQETIFMRATSNIEIRRRS